LKEKLNQTKTENCKWKVKYQNWLSKRCEHLEHELSGWKERVNHLGLHED